MEQWRDVPGYENYYQVSDLGRVRSLDRREKVGKSTRLRRGRVITPVMDRLGYLTLGLWANSDRERWTVHRLVMLAFVGPSDLQVNHKNGNKTDNRLENLEYVTCQENMEHRDRVLGMSSRGERSGKAVMTDAAVIRLRSLYATGLHSHRELAAMFGISKSNIGEIVNRKTWAHVA